MDSMGIVLHAHVSVFYFNFISLSIGASPSTTPKEQSPCPGQYIDTVHF